MILMVKAKATSFPAVFNSSETCMVLMIKTEFKFER